MKKVQNFLERFLDEMEDMILDPVNSVIRKVDEVGEELKIIQQKAKVVEKMLEVDAPDTSDMKKPLMGIPIQISESLKQLKTNVIEKLKSFLPSYTVSHAIFFARFALVPLLVIFIVNVGVSICVALLHPPSLPKTRADFNLFTLQPSVVSTALLFLFMLIVWGLTLPFLIFKFINGLIMDMQEKIKRALSLELDDIKKPLQAMEGTEQELGDFFSKVHELTNDLKRVEELLG